MKRILLTGGGTGGHIYPLIAVAQKLRELAASQSIEIRLHYIGATDALYSAYLAQENISISRIAHAKLRRYFSLLNFIDGLKYIGSIFQALITVALFRPHVVFSKGGPGALSVLCACRLYRVPIIIHESDSVPGLTNRITGKWAKKIEVAWEETRPYFPEKDVSVVGVPLRNDLFKNNKNQHDAKIDMQCDPHEPVLLILGGSQGSQRINALILKNLAFLLPLCSIIHQIGTANYTDYMRTYDSFKKTLNAQSSMFNRYHPYAYFENALSTAYTAADCIISRSGSVIFEIAAFGKPSILIPLPESASDHQRLNAYAYAKTEATIVIEENNLEGKEFTNVIQKILGDATTRGKMSAAARAFAKLDAAEKIARDVISLII